MSPSYALHNLELSCPCSIELYTIYDLIEGVK